MIRAAYPSGLTESVLHTLEARVLGKARGVMTARRFLDFEGPLGGGIESLQVGPVRDAPLEKSAAMISARRAIPIPTLYSAFEIPVRELEGSIAPGLPLDTKAGEDAAERVALAEETLLYEGAPELHIEGMLTHPGTQRVTLSEWSKPGGAIGDVIEAADRLDAAHAHGPFALVLAPALYNQLFRKYEGSDVLALDHLRRLADGGIYKSYALESAGVLVSPDLGPIVCAQDLEVRFIQVLPSTLSFMISSAVVLRIDEPKAACVLVRD